MNRNVLIVAAILVAVLILAGGFVIYNAVLGETEAASGPVTAPTLAVAAATSTAVPVAAQPAAPATAVPAEPTVVEAAPVVETAAPTQAANTGTGQNNSALPATGAGLKVYQISQAESEARFNIYEQLRGQPKDVIGTTSQVAGEVAVDLSDLSTAKVGEILINARTLVTDDDRRNGAIRNRILFTDQFEYISFKPTQISGLSGSAAPGQSFTFQVAGDLTIRDTAQPVVFDVTVNVESPERLTGTAKSSVKRADYGINIPSVPFVANVGDDVTLEIDFVLAPKS